MVDVNELNTNLFFGNEEIEITPDIKVVQPKIKDIIKFGEEKYWNLVHMFCCVGADMKFQLDDIGIDYTKISDFELFCKILAPSIGETPFIPNTKLEQFKLFQKDEGFLLCDYEKKLVIDEQNYNEIVAVIRKMHYMSRNNEIPSNDCTKKALIKHDRQRYKRAMQNKQSSSQLVNISSYLMLRGFKASEITEMPIYQFLTLIKRNSKEKDSDLLLQSGYSGFGVDLKSLDEKKLNYLGELD